jgi:CRISPR-associated protein (TIGR03986 family)
MKTIYRQHFEVKDIYGGWLKKVSEDKYIIEGYDKPGRISQKEIDRGLGTEFSAFFSVGGGYDASLEEDKSAKTKYDFANHLSLKNRHFSKLDSKSAVQLYELDEFGEQEGDLVFTGQPSVGEGSKRLEFIFWKKQNSIEVESEVMESFFDAYFEYDKKRWSIDWEKRREELANGTPVPVFFQKETWRGKERVQHLGLSYLYKLPGRSSIMQAVNRQQEGKGKLDLSEAIFGHVEGKTALKGRVQFGHAFAKGSPIEDSEKRVVLSGPKASFFPNYIKQKSGKNGKTDPYSTLRDDEPEISGWKRYPVLEKEIKHSPKPADAKSDKILTKFTPLKADTTFSFDIRYHNLRPVELGAILSALTFHNCSDAHHSLGMGKPLGYGKITLEVPHEIEVKTTQSEELTSKPTTEFMGTFEAYMNAKLGLQYPEWHRIDQIRELIAMAVGADYTGGPYLTLDQHRGVRNNGEYLERYSKLNPETQRELKPLTDKDEIAKIESKSHQEYAWFTFQNAYRKHLKDHQDGIQEVLISSFTKWKDDITYALGQKRKATRNAEEASSGPDWDQVDLSKKKEAFNTLKRVVEDFVKKREDQNDIKKVIQTYTGGYLSEADQKKVLEVLKAIFSECLNKKEKKKWQNDWGKNATMEKVAQWIGEEKARAFLETLNS